MSSALFLASALALPALGCSSADDAAASDESGEDSAELRVRGNSGFFVVTRPDFRRCIAPLCGGYYVKRVNATSSRCHDGSYANECYVSELDLDALGLSDEEKAEFQAAAVSGKAILRGGFESFAWNQVRLAKLKATEGWKGASDVQNPAGTTYRVTSSGIKCVRAPCPSLVEAKVNSTKSSRIHDLDLGITAPQPLIDEALASLDGDGILVTGANSTYGVPGSRGTQLVATEFYLRVKPAPVVTPVDQACGSRGMGPCPAGQYCDFPVSAACGTFDAGGTCKTQPDVCIKIYKPVCGCDGQTYGNDCMAHSAGVSVASEGACN